MTDTGPNHDEQPVEEMTTTPLTHHEETTTTAAATKNDDSASSSNKNVKILQSQANLQAMANQCDRLIASVAPELNEACELARRINVSLASELAPTTAATVTVPLVVPTNTANGNSNNATTTTEKITVPPAASEQAAAAFSIPAQHQQGIITQASTGGFSNTNHFIVCTGDYETDRICQLKRSMILRLAAQQPESKGEDRWDKPRVLGQRRRRIVREKDSVDAPAEPPPSGYVIFLGQMTIKLRHDRPNQPHNQAEVMSKASRMWRQDLTQAQQDYYKRFAEEARKEYKQQSLEFRATGTYKPSETFEKQPGAGLWTRKNYHEKNALEREIASYETVLFPPRPPEMDQAYHQRMKESLERRREKLRVPEDKRKRKPHGQGTRSRSKKKMKKAPPPPPAAAKKKAPPG